MPHSPKDLHPSDSLSAYRDGWRATQRLLSQGKSFSGSERNCVFLNCQGGPFANISAVSGLDFADDGRALATLDWDHDGDLDVWLYNRTGPRLRLMRNESVGKQSPNQYVAFRLRGVKCNRDAIGARVKLHLKGAEARPLIQTLRAGEGFLSQSSKWVHFGLGESPQIAEVSVRWPEGETESFTGIEPGHRYTLTQGRGEAAPWTIPERTLVLQSETQQSPAPTQIARIFMPIRVPMPPLQYDDHNGSLRQVPAGGGNPILVNFWASWCQPCLAELKELETRKDELQQRGLQVIALSVDGLGTDQDSQPADAVKALDQLGFTGDSGIARPETLEKIEVLNDFLFERLPAFAVPTSLLLDGQGRLAAIYRGPLELDTLFTDIANLNTSGERLREVAQRFPGRWLRDTAELDVLLVADQFKQRFPSDYQFLLRQALEQQTAAGNHAGQPAEQRKRLDEKQANTHVAMAEGLRAEGKLPEAAAHYESAVTLMPGHAQAHNDLGNVLTSLRQFERAERHYRLAIEIRDDFADAFYNLGVAQVMQQKMSEAIASWLKTIELDPTHSQAHANLGNAMAAQRKPKEAIRHFQQALEIEPKDPKAHYNLANTLRGIGQTEQALKHYRLALAAKPDYAKAHFSLAQALRQSGDEKGSIQHLGAAVENAPQDVSMKLALARMLASHPEDQLRDGKKALRLATEVFTATGGKNPLVLDALAAAQAETGQFDQAQKTIQQAINLVESALLSAPNESTRERYRKILQDLQSRGSLYQTRRPFRMPAFNSKNK